ncbi:hypothetical protein [Streptomyces avermitilis]|uniref:hypothetical protein n=1 Tax=Streptomyces avermitilis TaxID=33903 RepID=UPI003F4C137C
MQQIEPGDLATPCVTLGPVRDRAGRYLTHRSAWCGASGHRDRRPAADDRIMMGVEPSGMAEKEADMQGMINRRVKGLPRFKDYIEERGGETGA